MLVGALYGMYVLECLHWLAPGEHAYTRSRSGWNAHEVTPRTFTLQGRAPVWADPLLLHPGFIRTDAPPNARDPRQLRLVTRTLDRPWLLLSLCRTQAFVLLIYVPIIIVRHLLSALWPVVLALVLGLHLLSLTFAVVELRRTRTSTLFSQPLQLALNPLGCVRIFDILAQLRFSQIQRAARALEKSAPPTR